MTTPTADRANLFTVARLYWPSGLILSGRVQLTYTATDAYAVHMTVSCTPPGRAPQSQTWPFARDLLTRVVAEDTVAGDLDVIVSRHNHDELRVCLYNGVDSLDVVMPLYEVAKFIAETERCCAHGSIDEATRLSQQVDAAIVQCLRGAK